MMMRWWVWRDYLNEHNNKYNASTRQPEKPYTICYYHSQLPNISLLHARAFQVGKRVHEYRPETFEDDHNLSTGCPGYNY
jgi:hypothetical protein